MSDSLSLENIKSQLRELIPQGMGSTIQELKHLLPNTSKKWGEVIQLESRLNTANLNQRNGIISFAELETTYNKIRWDLINLVESLEEADFQVDKATKKSKRGSILYQIPGMMELNKAKRCIVRLAFKEEYLLENIELTADTHIESIRISEVMAVELLDPNEEAAFKIRTLNSPDQFVDEDDYSEWIFMVTPLLEGTYPLVLKVAVIEEIRGKERRREIVLEELIVITVDEVETEATFATADYAIQTEESARQINPISINPIPVIDVKSTPKPELIPTPSSQKTNQRLRRYAPILLFLLIASVGSWAFDVPQEINWLAAKIKDTSESYEKYIEQYGKTARHRETALFKKAQLQSSLDAYEDYLENYPEGKFSKTAENESTKLAYEELSDKYNTINEASELALINESLKAWKAYQIQYPNSPYQAEVASKIKELEDLLAKLTSVNEDLAAYQLALSENTIEAFENYLKAYPNGQFAEAARTQIEELRALITDNQTNTIEEEITSTASVDLEQLAFEQAQTLEQLQQYLKDFPNGKNRTEVLRKIALLTPQIAEETPPITPKVTYGSFKDARDGQVYKILTYNGQTWMAENLNYNAQGSFCYNKNETNCYEYGRLYPWDVAYYACPSGWHLPTDKEWRTFAKQFGGSDEDAADGGKSAFLALSGQKVDFNIGFGGERDADGKFNNQAVYANYWTVTPYASSNAYYYYFAGAQFGLLRSKSYKKYSFSCRCVKD